MDLQQVKVDRMLYTKDKASANLVLLAIVFDCLYFISLYKSDVGAYYYTWIIGASVVYNLLFMLTAFLASESVKSRKPGFTVILIVIGVLQFARMAFLPTRAHNTVVEMGGVARHVMENGQYTFVLLCLALSGICCIAAALVSYRNYQKLSAYKATIDTEHVERID